MNRIATVLVFLVGCSDVVITSEKTDEVAGTCTFVADFPGGWSTREVGEQTITVRPYAADDRACMTMAKVACDDFRSLCTARIGYREHLYESSREPVAEK